MSDQPSIPVPSIGRTEEDIRNVGDFATLIKDAEAKGRFFCLKCKAKLTNVASTVPNDGQDHVLPCPHCREPLLFNAAWLVAKVLEARRRELAGLGPAVDPSSEDGSIREVQQPNGRKLIIATPGPARVRAVVPHGEI